MDELLAISPASLGATGKACYEKITAEVYAKECEEVFPTAKRNCEVANYNTGIPKLERILKMNEGYADGEAMLILMKAYQKTEA
ncbi:MAG: hypothetical protein UHS49_05975, partial [Faecalimonas sp.]|nr:hypothetical protein [Faecalimonas sp.]